MYVCMYVCMYVLIISFVTYSFIAFVRMHPNLDVPVSYSQIFSSCCRRLPINIHDVAHMSRIAGASQPRKTGLVWTRFRFVHVVTGTLLQLLEVMNWLFPLPATNIPNAFFIFLTKNY